MHKLAIELINYLLLFDLDQMNDLAIVQKGKY